MNNKHFIFTMCLIFTSLSLLLTGCEGNPEDIYPPTKLEVYDQSPSNLYLSWEEADIDGCVYNIYRSSKEDGDFIMITENLDSTYYSDEVGMLKTYYYYVTTVYKDSESEPSEIVSCTSGFSYPENIKYASAIEGFQLSWTAIEGIDYYKIYYYSDYSDYYYLLDKTSENTYLDVTTYTFRKYKISSVYGDNESSRSDSVNATATILSTPKNVNILSTPIEVSLSWDEVDEATFYIIYKGDRSSSLKKYDTTNETSYTDFSDISSTHYYSIAAFNNNGGRGTQTEKKSGKRSSLNAPQGLTGENSATNTFKLTWEEAEYTTSYDVYVSDDSSSSNAELIENTKNNFYDHDISNLSAGNLYFWVKSKHENGNESSLGDYYKGFIMGKPEISSITIIDAGYVQLNWSLPEEPEEMKVDIFTSDTENGTFNKVETVDSKLNKCKLSEVQKIGENYYKIQLSYNGVSSNESDVKSVKLDGKVTDVSATDGTLLNEITITWDANAYANHYKLFFCSSVDGEYSILENSISTTSYTHDSLPKGQKYYYKVAAVTADDTVLPQSNANKGEAFGVTPKTPEISSYYENFNEYLKIVFYSTPGAKRYRIAVWKDIVIGDDEFLGYVADYYGDYNYSFSDSPIYFSDKQNTFIYFQVIAIYTSSGDPDPNEMSISDMTESCYY